MSLRKRLMKEKKGEKERNVKRKKEKTKYGQANEGWLERKGNK
jgi:hypothetical protein